MLHGASIRGIAAYGWKDLWVPLKFSGTLFPNFSLKPEARHQSGVSCCQQSQRHIVFVTSVSQSVTPFGERSFSSTRDFQQESIVLAVRSKSTEKQPAPIAGKSLATAVQLGSYVLHAVVLIAVIILTVQFPGKMIPFSVVGSLIGPASISTVKHRFAPLFVAFGLAFAPAFWMCVASINRRDYIELLVPLLLIAGVTWALQQPQWPAAIFTAVVVAVYLVVLGVEYSHRFNNDFLDANEVVREVSILAPLFSLTLLEVIAGTIMSTTTVKKPKRPKKALIKTPTDLWP